ncbi:MAG: hypothetical protein AAB641_00600 [Patescibacteria group bacterium]
MKKLLFIIVIAAALFYLLSGRPTAVENKEPQTTNSFRPDASNATFTFDDEAVTLSNGRNTGTSEETEILEKTAYGDLNADGKEDAIMFLARSGGGSGVFIYAAAYVSGPINYKGSNAVFLGDRIAPQNVSIKNGVATVSYLDRAPDEPLAAEPTFIVSKELIYKNGTLEEK